MPYIDQSIEIWKKRLLDLGKRNRLINYRETKRSNIKILSPSIDELYTRLVIDEEHLAFSYADEMVSEDVDGDGKGITVYGDLQTDRNISEQQKTLRNLRSKAKLAVEEQGVNILYLSFGFLQWQESADSDQTLLSPIVLVPVTLTLESITSPFVLSLHEDEIVLNPTLTHKLENDFGIELPELDADPGDILKYLGGVARIAGKNRWGISVEAGLSLFSFLKINMYRDLENNKEKIRTHPIIKALAGDVSAIMPVPEDLNNFNHDERTKPVDVYQVVDADSSQQDAILFSKKGVSFVLQGPPGTGKSQTITNIIAENLAEGKKVLFVSEKMAALEVVHKRLSQAKLDDFCLTLHSHKANKRAVLNQLGKSLNLNKFRLQDEAIYQLQILENDRDKLNRYSSEVYTPCLPLGKSIYEINGRLAKLLATPDMIFSLDRVGGTTAEKLNLHISLLNELTQTMGKMSEDYAVNPWRGCNLPYVSHEIRHNIETYLRRFAPKLKDFAEHVYETRTNFGIPSQESLSSVARLVEILNVSSRSPKVPVSWISGDKIAAFLELAAKYRDKKTEYRRLSSELGQIYDKPFFALPAIEIHKNFDRQISIVMPALNPSTFPSYAEVVTAIPSTRKRLDATAKKIVSILGIGELAADLLGLKPLTDFQSVSNLVNLLDCLLANPKPTQDWFNIDRFQLVKRLYTEARKAYEEIQTETESLVGRYEKEILNMDHAAMLGRFRTEYTSILRIFKKNYRSDKKLIKSLAKNHSKKMEDSEIINVLHELKSIGEKKSWIADNHDLMNSLLGSNYLGAYTDWTAFETAINNFEKIAEFFGLSGISISTRNHLLDAGAKIEELRPLHNQIISIWGPDLPATLHEILSPNETVDTLEQSTLKQRLETVSSALEALSQEYSKMRQFAKQEILFDDVIGHFSKLEQMQGIAKEIELENERLLTNYQFLYHGIDTDWDTILHALAWTSDFKKIAEKYALPSSFIERICGDDASIKLAAESLTRMKRSMMAMEEECRWFVSLFDDKEEILNCELDSLLARIENCLHSLSSLEEWIDFRSARKKCREAGLSDLLEKIEATRLEPSSILPAFLKRFYRLWLDDMLPQHPAVQSFRRRTHEEVIQEFSKLDKSQLTIAQARIREYLVSKLPDLNRFTSAVDEVAVLKRELNKQRRILPLRKLFRAIPNLLLTLKPCLMMSPLSVSLFLEANDYRFDVVIFDEASQVCTEDAIGTIMRGAQVVIAGDSKQLPPTSFFTATTSEGDFDIEEADEDEFTDADAFESILDQAVTVLPERTLRWHYRSRHEHLIAFSNAKIYHNDLITFPSHIDREPDNGVEYVYVPKGIYDRSGKRNNVAEATKVAELVFEQLMKYPKRSLGVVTFSEAQQQAVEAAIRQRRLLDQRYEDYFSEEKEEAFFIKNLENVQGDERDTIIFSIGYAKDHNGVMYMNFGPLSRDGGYRRLNVAITRAKYNIKLVGSILPADINLEHTNAEGVKMLRSYIDYAMHGPEILQREVVASENVTVDSPFEESVYNFLVSQGFRIATQVGCSGYRIDLGVKHPTLSGRYVLGIECDGATYHSARTARERDRLRQAVLEDIGWKIYRIWSTDWVKDPHTEGQKLVETIRKAIDHYSEYIPIGEAEINRDCETPQDMTDLEKEFPIESLASESPDNSNPYDFECYEEANVNSVTRPPNDVVYVSNVIMFVVNHEYPIHEDLLCKRLACLFGNQKATNRVHDYVKYVLNKGLKNEIQIKDSFYWPKGITTAKVRIPGPQNLVRPIKYISTEELAEAMWKIASRSFGIEKDNLFVVTARVFGFNRTGGNITQNMQKALDHLVLLNKVKNTGEKVIV
jgi:very-short-patch-repair endonuclease